MHHRFFLALVGALALAACGPSAPTPRGPGAGTATPASAASNWPPAATAGAQTASAPAPGTRRFRSKRLGFYIDYPQAMAASRRFDSHYLANASWKTYAKPGSPGAPVLMLTVPGSDQVTAAELRIGISQAAQQVRQCTRPGAAAQPPSAGRADINGTLFTTWHARDAGMSHYLKVHSYRVVHDQGCYAIDLLVIGTNPAVYQPPKTPPFSHKQAFAALREALQGFHFTR